MSITHAYPVKSEKHILTNAFLKQDICCFLCEISLQIDFNPVDTSQNEPTIHVIDHHNILQVSNYFDSISFRCVEHFFAILKKIFAFYPCLIFNTH